MVRLTGTFSRINPCKVMVVGDLILDTYTIGKARRISPEAPVAVVHVQNEESRPGGSGNVILNLVSLGAEVVAVGRVGNDPAGKLLINALEEEGVNSVGIVAQPQYPTPIKNRIIADNQQIVRVDHELLMPVTEKMTQDIIDRLPSLLEGIQVIAISDYGKGFLSKALLEAILKKANALNIPVITDPKGIDFSKYVGTTIIKPNLSEAYAAANLLPDAPLEEAAKRILQLTGANTVMITRSEAGIALFHKDGTRNDFPVRVREIKDVTGAGDTVLATLTCAIANHLSLAESAQLCNVAAGIAIEHFGCARVTLPELARRLLEFDVVNKVFDEEHVFALQQALKNQKCIVLGITGSQGLTSAIFNSIRKLAKKDHLLVYIRDGQPSEEFVNILASFHDVDFIILKTDSLRHLCTLIEPAEIYSLDGDSLQMLEHVQHLL